MFIVAASIVIVRGVERLVRQYKPQYINTLLTVLCINMSLVAESNDWYVNTVNKLFIFNTMFYITYQALMIALTYQSFDSAHDDSSP